MLSLELQIVATDKEASPPSTLFWLLELDNPHQEDCRSCKELYNVIH